MKDVIQAYADKLEETAAKTLPYIRNASIMKELKRAILNYEKAKKLDKKVEKKDGKAD